MKEITEIFFAAIAGFMGTPFVVCFVFSGWWTLKKMKEEGWLAKIILLHGAIILFGGALVFTIGPIIKFGLPGFIGVCIGATGMYFFTKKED